jgi:F-type H+-transporting ATPase subunit b
MAGVRFQTTERKEPSLVATSLLDKFAGDSLAAKSSTVMITASIASYLISKEIYIIDGEFFEMMCLFGAYYVWYSNGKTMAKDYFKGRQDQIKSVLENARKDHSSVVQERITHIQKMSDTVEVTEALYEISKDIAKLEAQAYELKQKVGFTNEVKQTLDQWVYLINVGASRSCCA